jgi:hypothetical protein
LARVALDAVERRVFAEVVLRAGFTPLAGVLLAVAI